MLLLRNELVRPNCTFIYYTIATSEHAPSILGFFGELEGWLGWLCLPTVLGEI